MSKLPLYDINGISSGEVSAAAKIFGVKMNEHVVHSALVWFQASQRRGTHSTKTKAEVRGGGRKPWKQKGTGRARAGSIRSPLWRKGGVIFGPKPRDYGYSLPIKVRKGALRIALSDKVRAEKVKVVEELKLADAKTKSAAKLFKELKVAGKVLIVLVQANEGFEKAARNLAGIKICVYNDLNIFDLLEASWLVVEKKAIKALEEFLV
ncbi:MAG: 50S ribosomal protein L4 [Candidatus Margulisbacteria bacterium]|nr:50S ribosomal protein L4 [Candidatus Margulisiibacteriota bacterium]